MYDLEKESSVLFKVESRWHYSYTVWPGSSVKKPVMYSAFTRPVIPWSLECDLANITRKDLLQIIENRKEFYYIGDWRGCSGTAMAI